MSDDAVENSLFDEWARGKWEAVAQIEHALQVHGDLLQVYPMQIGDTTVTVVGQMRDPEAGTVLPLMILFEDHVHDITSFHENLDEWLAAEVSRLARQNEIDEELGRSSPPTPP